MEKDRLWVEFEGEKWWGYGCDKDTFYPCIKFSNNKKVKKGR